MEKVACWLGWHRWVLALRTDYTHPGREVREVLWFVCPQCAKRRELRR
jgi:hypothetical protein